MRPQVGLAFRLLQSPLLAAFRKILVANRGEIAVRVVRSCREMGIPSVAVYSEVDRASLHVRLADEAVPIGPAPARESYLSIERVVEAALRAGAEAVHPGYGFLSENARFAQACADAGLVFIGPPPAAMELMGSKTGARAAMQAAGVPVVPGTTEPLKGAAEAARVAEEIGFPVMLKASAGGGGKGMRLVGSAAELTSALDQAAAEAEAAFGDAAVYIEKAIIRPRHIEVQVLADAHGNVIHLGERECSLQRRHQKVVEETPSPFIERRPEVRERLTAAAVEAARACGYVNAGTVEMLMDADYGFYFLEMNTRLQVEHPVTELVTGLDLVREQILIAAGEPLRYGQDDIRPRGHAMECRVYAEDPANNFFPSPGRITALEEPGGPNVRVDSGAYAGWTVPVEYDPLLAKLSAWAPTREEAAAKLRAALDEYHVGGIHTTLGFFRDVLRDPDFLAGEIDTGFIDRFLAGDRPEPAADPPAESAALAAALAAYRAAKPAAAAPAAAGSRWRAAQRERSVR